MKQKIVFLEGIRGVAALIVVFAHFVQVFLPAGFSPDPTLSRTKYEGLLRDTPFNILYNGSFAVAIFFILSGYVLSYRYFQTHDAESVVNMAKKRYPRLAIPALCSVLLAFVLIQCQFIFLKEVTTYTRFSIINPYETILPFMETIKLALTSNFFYFKSIYNPVLWTMTYELFGSFLIFSFLLLFGKSKFRFVMYIVLTIYFFKSFFLAFVMGMFMSDVHQRPFFQWNAMFQRVKPFFLFLVGGIGIYLGSYPYGGVKDTIYAWLHVFDDLKFLELHYFVFYHIIGAALLFAVILQVSFLQKLFSLRLFEYIGKLSFSLYLVHFVVISSFSSYVFMQLMHSFSYGISFLGTFLLSLPILWGVSHLMYVGVDQTTIKLLSNSKKTTSVSFVKPKG